MTEKALDKKQVLHIATLCRLELNESQIKQLSQMLGETIDYIEVLNELDTSKVSETYQVTGLTNVFQEENDESTTLDQKEALANANNEIDNLFGTKAVLDR